MKFVDFKEDKYEWDDGKNYETLPRPIYRKWIIEVCSVFNSEIERMLISYKRKHSLEKLCAEVYLPYEFIEKNFNHIKPFWDIIISRGYFPEEFIEKHYNLFKDNLLNIFSYQEVSEKFIQNHIKDIDFLMYWITISSNQDLSEDFMLINRKKLIWKFILEKKKISLDLLTIICREELTNDWNLICEKQDLSDDFIEEFADCVNWKILLERMMLSTYICDKFRDILKPIVGAGLKYLQKT